MPGSLSNELYRFAQRLGRERGGEVAKMLARPDSFKASVVAALLKFDPDGPEWSILERIYNDIADQWKKEKAGE